MSAAVEVTVSLPEEMLESIERVRRERRESRSEFFRRAVEELLHARREGDLDEQYVQGYLRCPETEEEVSAAWALAAPALSGEPWA